METFELGVGSLLQFVLRSGSIDSRQSGKSRMQQGARIHRMLQEREREVRKNYESEVYLKYTYIFGDYAFALSGRADAIYTEKGKPVIEEIKTTNERKGKKFEPKELHIAQLKFYGYFYMQEHGLDEIDLKLRYYHTATQDSTYFAFKVTKEELEEFIESILAKWLEVGVLKSDWRAMRDATIVELPFVYGSFRKGQREMSLAIFNTIRRKNNVLVEAPTGIGKTAASLYSAIKSLTENPDYQIYYLTAKTTVQNEANKALRQMRELGLMLKSTTITARDKICFLNQVREGTRNCNPDDCEYAKDFYDKLTEVLPTCLKGAENYDRAYIEEVSRKWGICPYQLSLELSNWSDVVICDYNYAFDPVSRLETVGSNRICLIDEAHNLPDRSRSMFSAEINHKIFADLTTVLRDESEKPLPGAGALMRCAKEAALALSELKVELVPEDKDVKEFGTETLDDLLETLYRFQEAASLYFLRIQEGDIEEPDDEVFLVYNECSKAVYQFLVISEYFFSNEEKYRLYAKAVGRDIVVKLACLDASSFISETLESNPAILFSATLTPFDYYKKVLLGNEDTPSIAVPSPFDRSHYKVICDSSLSTRYSDREFSTQIIAREIDDFVNAKRGHYLVFFPSYAYLSQVLEEYKKLNPDEEGVLVQKSVMDDSERAEFISRFKEDPEEPLVGFCVMGGVFSEGVDLPLDELIGTVIIGPGLPGMDYERDLIKEYYQKENGEGYAYAYAYPGMNRVLQSAGRVIRTEQDRGVILLIDDRFKNPFYRRMLPDHLIPEYHTGAQSVKSATERFWRTQSGKGVENDSNIW